MEQQEVNISELGANVQLPGTTVLRWLETLRNRGLVTRAPDKSDARRVFIELTTDGAARMERWFETASHLFDEAVAGVGEREESYSSELD